jgi:hypothetical protein
MMKLYRVTTIVKEYDGCKNVAFAWFKSDSRDIGRRRPYADLIADYDPSMRTIGYAEEAIEELFTEDEAKQLVAYLDREKHGDQETTIEEQVLPIPNNFCGCSPNGVGGGDDYYMLDQRPDYSLPFKVWGYFDLVGCELVDGSGVYHQRYLLLSPNGEMRMQTNAEAAAMEHSLVGAEGAAADKTKAA